MILIFGGTTEGKKAAAVCDKATQSFFYSTKNREQSLDSVHAIRLYGAMDREKVFDFCHKKSVRLIIDAAHPFAEELHRNIAHVSRVLSIPVIRYERQYPERDPHFHWFNDYTEAMQFLEKEHINNLLALTGVNTIAKLKPYWSKHNCWFRILNRPKSLKIATEIGFPKERLLFYDPQVVKMRGESILDEEILKKMTLGAILTKESGVSGGFIDKALIAKQLKIPLLVICRPQTDLSFVPVYGDHGLRREIERLMPDFFPLRTGLTTGTCATAATSAALHALLTGEKQSQISIFLPDGESIDVSVSQVILRMQEAVAEVVKDSGDDPDITNGISIVSTVRFNKKGRIRFFSGEGIGTVTLPGLGLEIGAPAINAVPHRMMEAEVTRQLKKHQVTDGVDITISSPGGFEVAQRTFNPKLGIVRGLSILGTSGIVQPFSSEAFRETIRREMDVARALGCNHLIINSGARSERLIRNRFPELPPQAFIHYGNFIGDTLRMASEGGFRRVTMGIMIGKAVKLAEGMLNTHSKLSSLNLLFLTQLATEAGCTPNTIEKIAQITLVRQLWEVIPESETLFFDLLVEKCRAVCTPLFDHLEIILLSD